MLEGKDVLFFFYGVSFLQISTTVQEESLEVTARDVQSLLAIRRVPCLPGVKFKRDLE
jgi:hypothetical protein